MKNPYSDPVSSETVLPGRRMASCGIAAFCLFLAMPPLLGWRGILSPDPSASSLPTLREKLRAFEKKFSNTDLLTHWRTVDQKRLVSWFREGNERVLIGKEGWLYYRADIDAVVGKGPRYEEPPSVARDPRLASWQSPLPVIEDFAKQLQERNIRLVLVPVPTKAMIVPRGLGADQKEAYPTDYGGVLEELRAHEIEVVDLMQTFADSTDRETLYLRQDTHWRPQTMQRAAKELGGQLARQLASQQSPDKISVELREVERTHSGDLVGMLSEETSHLGFAPETVTLHQVIDPSSGKPIASDPDSSLVLLGDSFVNVYEDPSLGFGIEGEKRIGAGFASHLAAELKQSIQVIASNGGGATAVRQAFAESLAVRDTEPSTAVWVLSARDLFLPELSARRAQVEWRPVSLPTRKKKTEPSPSNVILTATLRQRSSVGDPTNRKQTPYDSAIYSALFDDVTVDQGTYEAKEAWIFLWAFQKRKLMPTAHLEVGKRYRLQLQPFPKEGPASKAKQLDEFFRIDLDRYFVTEFEEVK